MKEMRVIGRRTIRRTDVQTRGLGAACGVLWHDGVDGTRKDDVRMH